MKSVTKLEYNSALFLSAFPLFIGYGFSKIINTAGADAWISVIIGTILGLIINYFHSKLPSEENKVCAFLSNYIILALVTLIITKLISSIYLDEMPNILVMIPGILLILYTAKKGSLTLFKAASLLLIIFLSLCVIPVASLGPTINLDYFKPIAINPIGKILYAAVDFALISTVPFITLPNFKERYNPKVYLGAGVLLFIIITTTIGNIGVDLAQAFRYPMYMVFKRISLLSFIENIENILFFIWIINIFIVASNSLIKIKDNSNKWVFWISLALMVFVTNFYIIDSNKGIELLTDNFTYVVLGIFVISVIGKLLKIKKHNE